MSLTFLAKSLAYSWKMSFEGQVLCQRMLIGPVWAWTDGAAMVAVAAVAPAAIRNLRRLAVFESDLMLISRPLPRAVWAALTAALLYLRTSGGCVLFRRMRR